MKEIRNEVLEYLCSWQKERCVAMACGIPRRNSAGRGFFKQKCRKRCRDWALFGGETGDTKGKRIGFYGAAYTKETRQSFQLQRLCDLWYTEVGF